jgi:crotonobetainyl-CoA:carnitine CoA-transferase CaiB-like acyl-CoA transferase
MAYKLLKEIRVLDLTMVYAGPMGARMFADLGAEVIKIESPTRPDMFTRANVYPDNEPTGQAWDCGGYFHTINAGKRGISLDLGTDKGKEIFKKLVKISDIVMENFSPRVMDNLGIGYDVLKGINPEIIMVSMSGLGHYGPLRDFYMYMTGMEGMSGMTYISGHSDQPPLLSNFAYGDWMLGVTGTMSVLTALYNRKKTGRGQYIDISGREAIITHIGDVIMDSSLNNRVKERSGNDHPGMAPHQCYQCKGTDAWVNVAVENDEQFRALCDVISKPELKNDSKFADAAARVKNRNELDQIVEAWTKKHDHYEAMDLLQKAGVPAGAALSMKDVHLNPHLAERGFFDIIDQGAEGGKRPIVKQMPAKLTDVEAFTPKRAPRFAEDNEYVFCELLGMSKEEVSKLTEEKVTGTIPRFPPGRPARTDLIEKQVGKGAGYIDPDYLAEIRKTHGDDLGKK